MLRTRILHFMAEVFFVQNVGQTSAMLRKMTLCSWPKIFVSKHRPHCGHRLSSQNVGHAINKNSLFHGRSFFGQNIGHTVVIDIVSSPNVGRAMNKNTVFQYQSFCIQNVGHTMVIDIVSSQNVGHAMDKNSLFHGQSFLGQNISHTVVIDLVVKTSAML